LRPGLFSDAPVGAWDGAIANAGISRGLGIPVRTPVGNVETPSVGTSAEAARTPPCATSGWWSVRYA
jgi:hypothetical protein